MTTGRHRLYRGGHRQANAALHRAVIVRMQFHTPTLTYVERRTAEGRPKREIIRCLSTLRSQDSCTNAATPAELANIGQNRSRRPPETIAPPNVTSVVTPVCSSTVAKKPSSGNVTVAEARLYRASHPIPT